MNKQCTQCGSVFTPKKFERLCPECRKSNNVRKAKAFNKDKKLNRIVVYDDTKKKIMELAADEGINVYDYLKRIIDNL